MKNYKISIDVTMSGDIYIEAKNEMEVQEIIKKRSFVPSDLKDFHYVSKEIIEVEEEK